MTTPNIRTVRKMIAAAHPGYDIVQGEGYVYFVGPDTDAWYSSSVAVCRVGQMPPERWVEALTAMRTKAADGLEATTHVVVIAARYRSPVTGLDLGEAGLVEGLGRVLRTGDTA